MNTRPHLMSVTLAAVMLACSLSSPADEPSTTSQPQSTPIPKPSETTPPTSAPASATPAGTPDGSGIEIQGPKEFIEQAQAALDLLATCDPAALAEVDTQLEAIVHSDRSGMDVSGGAFLASNSTAFAPGYSQTAQIFWFAGAMVHDAHHRQQAANGVTTDWDQLNLEERQAIEHDARAVQIEAMESCQEQVAESDQPQVKGMISYLAGMQTGEIPCDYCEVEWADRDW